VIQAAAVLLQLPEQPATIVSWQAADHREQVLGELGIGHYPMPISLNKGPELQGGVGQDLPTSRALIALESKIKGLHLF
jgi:hypothetical protein